MQSPQERPVPSYLPSLFKSLHNVASTPSTSSSERTNKTKEILREELGSWWNKGQEGVANRRSHSMNRTASSELPSNSRPYHTIPANPRRSSTPSHSASSSSAVPLSAQRNPPTSYTGRAHLHYRDENAAPVPSGSGEGVVGGSEYTFTPNQAQPTAPSMGRSSSIQKPPADSDEESSLKRAIEESWRELQSNSDLAAREEAELQRALQASSAISPPSTSTSEQAQLAQAIRASQFPSQSTSHSDAPASLEESERQLFARNEKGSLWAEGGSHGWLPPGASRPGEEDEERRMLEMAIQISLEEEAARKDRMAAMGGAGRSGPPQIPPRPTEQSMQSYATSSSGDKPITPSRPLPPPPNHPSQSNFRRSTSESGHPIPSPFFHSNRSNSASTANSIPSSPTSPHREGRQLSFVAPSPPKIFTYDDPGSHSPQELPYLTSSHSLRRSVNDPNSTTQQSPLVPSAVIDQDLTSTPSTPSSVAFSGQTEDSPSELSVEGALSIRNPDPTPPPEIASPDAVVEEPEEFSQNDAARGPVFPVFHSTMAGRSLSLLSEHTEPSRTSSLEAQNGLGSMHISPDEPMLPQLVGSKVAGEQRTTPAAPTRPPPQPPSTHVQSLTGDELPSAASSAEGVPAELDTSSPPPTAQEAATNPNSTSPEENTEQVTVFGDGVRFGWPAPCAQEHVCAADGLHSEAPFPDSVMLSVVETGGDNSLGERGKFSVEGRTWVGLLRFLMWYGDTTVSASSADLDATDDHHCDATMTLEFRQDDEGSGVLRLTVSLLPPNSRPTTSELTATTPDSPLTSGKGKSRSRSSSSNVGKIYTLPDTLVLPTRLSSIAITLYSLRHLAGIAASTQPSKTAAPSYHALRSLSISINSLAQEHDDDRSKNSHQMADEERLLGRLRDRLRKMRSLGASGTAEGQVPLKGARLTKAPPQASRVTAVPRQSRVLSSDDGASSALGMAGVLVLGMT